MDRLDRRQRSVLGSLTVDSVGTVRSAEDDLVASDRSRRTAYGELRPPQSLALSRPRQRAVLQGSRPGPIRIASASGSTCAIPSCPPDPFADATEVSGRQDRRARQDGCRRLLLRRADRHRRPAAVSESGLRRERAQEVELGALLQRSELLLRPDLVRPYRVGMSCAFCHVGPNPIKPPADPENPKWENLSSNVGAQYFWWDRIFNWRGEANEGSFFYQLLHTSRPGYARHVARLDRQHQQPAHDERRLLPRPADGPARRSGARRRSAAAA